ncbi:uncharacterized protein LOC127249437 [Andrographis paniculata]|uniref:uncharacterized protein LOC127249437 n=1 Tax=Andrographis paniculata TaxID=175694 RepID=UPI0021E85075|nr:uncharacterized protein LOC127249437 [Andrographis paniculata]
MSNWMLSMKAVMISAGIVILAMEIKLTVPIAADWIPAMWSAFLEWMKPPYLYIIINGIILTIAASSRFQQSQEESPPNIQFQPENLSSSVRIPAQPSFEAFSDELDFSVSSSVENTTAAMVHEIVAPEMENAVVEFKPPVENDSKNDIETEKKIVFTSVAEDVFVDSTSTDTFSPEVQSESLLTVTDKPLVSSRFVHRKPIRNVPEVSNTRALRVARPKKQETLESTWRMITEGRHVPITRHQKKADAWELHQQQQQLVASRPAARIRKEPSPGQDELNRRVEAFIKKFNEEMRIQRQESLKQFMEMINRAR